MPALAAARPSSHNPYPSPYPYPTPTPTPTPNQVMAQLLFDALRESWHVFEKTG